VARPHLGTNVVSAMRFLPFSWIAFSLRPDHDLYWDYPTGRGRGCRDRQSQHKTMTLSVLGNVADACVEYVANTPAHELSSVHNTEPQSRVAAGERLDEFGLPVSWTPANARISPARTSKETPFTAVKPRFVLDEEVRDVKDHLAGVGGRLFDDEVDVATHHHGREGCFVGLGGRRRAHDLTEAHHVMTSAISRTSFNLCVMKMMDLLVTSRCA